MHALLIQPVLDDIFIKRDEEMLWLVPAAVLVIAVIKGGAMYGNTLILKFVGQRMVSDMQLQMYGHLLHTDVASYADQSTGAMVSRFTNDIHIIRRTMTQALVGMVKEFLTLVFLICVVVYQSWELAILGLAAFPIAVYPVLKLGRRMRKVSHSIQEELGEFTKQLDDTFQGIRMVKAYNREAEETARASTIMERIFRLYIKAARTESAASPIMEVFAGAAIAGVVLFGGMQVFEGETTPGAFFSIIAALLMAYKPMKALSNLNTALQEGLAAIRRLFELLDTEPVVKDQEGASELNAKDAAIAFDHVSFNYEPSKAALKDICLEVPAGKRVALVGPSGGGKTTIMNLILRFYDPESGAIRINDRDIRDVTQASLRQHIALVNQEATLFDSTVRENILYGNPEASERAMKKAAKDAAADEFIVQLPQGYDTPIGQHGVKLSGGQRQRIAIARAMLKDAPILLLDEATSALDTVSEQQVQKALNRLMEGRTTLVIAHRLSTIQDADIIYVIEAGQVVETGTHQALMKRDGVYAELQKQQLFLAEGDVKSAGVEDHA